MTRIYQGRNTIAFTMWQGHWHYAITRQARGFWRRLTVRLTAVNDNSAR